MVIKWCFLAASCAAIAIALLAVRPHPTPGPIARDFEAYWAAGNAYDARADGYGRAIWSSERNVPGVDARRNELLPFVNPPATLALWSPLGRLPYETAARIWLAVLAGALAALITAVIWGCGARLDGLTVLGMLALAVSFGPVTSDLSLGQFALVAFLGAALVSLFASRSSAATTAAACVALGQPNVAVGLLSQLGRKGVLVAAAFGGVVAYLAGAIFAGPRWPVSYAQSIRAHGFAEQFAAIQFTPTAILYGFGTPPFAARVVGALCFALGISALFPLVRRVKEPFARFAAFSALAPFIAGFFHEHDFVVALAAGAWCAVRSAGVARIFGLAGTLLVAVDWLGLAQRPSGIAQSALLASAAFAAFIALGETKELAAALLLLPAFAALFGAAAWLGAHHRVPVWPDALRPFDAGAATVATIWSLELRASGLLAVQPAWAMLRSLSLLGCAMLSYAIYRHSSYYRTRQSRWDESS